MSKSRRVTIVLMLLAASVLAVGAWQAWAADNRAGCVNCPPRNFVGVSDNGSFQEALDDAIAQAFAYFNCPNCADIMVTWELVRTTGRQGGIAGFNQVFVEISAR